MYCGVSRSRRSEISIALYWLISTLVIAAPAAAAPTSSDSQENIAVPVIRMSATRPLLLRLLHRVEQLGIKIAARMPMIAITIKSSISVKPVCFPRVYASSQNPSK